MTKAYFGGNDLVPYADQIAIVTDDAELIQVILDHYDIKIEDDVKNFNYKDARKHIDVHEEIEAAFEKFKLEAKGEE